MNASHIENLKTIYANIKHARRNDMYANIGGGTFNADELLSLELAVAKVINDQRTNGSEHDKVTL